VFNPWQTVAEIAKTSTLYPGDVICMGTTLNAAPIVPGDSMEIRIDGIGSLINGVIAEQRVAPRVEGETRVNLAAAA
jgi:2-keto-4-pentenoate hydratase/2-oxohepta-3-ene-1,7-dioic acid hydratase in catechol pathway